MSLLSIKSDYIPTQRDKIFSWNTSQNNIHDALCIGLAHAIKIKSLKMPFKGVHHGITMTAHSSNYLSAVGLISVNALLLIVVPQERFTIVPVLKVTIMTEVYLTSFPGKSVIII